MRLRGRLLLVCSTMLLGGCLVGLLSVFSPQATAEATDIVEEAETGDVDPDADKEHDPPTPLPESPNSQDFHALYPAGEGDDVLTYDQLDAIEKEVLDNSALWAETGNGHAVQSRWARASKEKRRRAKAKRAQQLSGTQGLDEMGIN